MSSNRDFPVVQLGYEVYHLRSTTEVLKYVSVLFSVLPYTLKFSQDENFHGWAIFIFMFFVLVFADLLLVQPSFSLLLIQYKSSTICG